MTTEKHIKLGRLTAFISFLIGTLIFGLYYISDGFYLLLVGYGYILLAGFINVVVLVSILVRANKDKENKQKLLFTCRLMVLNVPILLVYLWLTNLLLNTMRITFINSTQTNLSNIDIIGGAGGHIDELKIGESKTVWVGIIGDGSIDIGYLSDGQLKKECVVSYVTSNMGQKMEYNIGGQDNEKF